MNVSPDDVSQEIALLELEGVENPSRLVVRRRLQTQEGCYLSLQDDEAVEIPMDDGRPPWKQGPPIPPTAVYESLISWTLSQASSVQNLIWSFLDNPTDAAVESLIRRLQREGVLNDSEKPVDSRLSITELIKRALPAFHDDLVQLVQDVSPETQRPAATVRQVIRRLSRKGTIHQDSQGEWTCS